MRFLRVESFCSLLELTHKLSLRVAVVVVPREPILFPQGFEFQTVFVAVAVVGLSPVPIAVLNRRVSLQPPPIAMQIVASHPKIEDNCTRARFKFL